MFRALFFGIVAGGAAVYLDALVIMGSFGFETPIAIIVACVMCALALVGIGRVEDKDFVVLTVVGMVVGIFTTSLVRVKMFVAESLLA